VCTEQMHHILTSRLLGNSIKESMDHLSEIVLLKFPQLKIGPESIKHIEEKTDPITWVEGDRHEQTVNG
jgi:hypothetical protein